MVLRGQDVHLTSQSLGPASASLDPRTELVLETTVDDARRVRQIPDVHHISQREVGQNGRVRITVKRPESVTTRSSLCANTGLLFHQSVEQWEELSSLLSRLEHAKHAVCSQQKHFDCFVQNVSASAHPSSGSFTPGGTLMTTSTSPIKQAIS